MVMAFTLVSPGHAVYRATACFRWAFAVDLPSVDGQRRPSCRSGFPTRTAAAAALQQLLENEESGLETQADLTVAAYLTSWLHSKQEPLRPTTYARYRDNVLRDLIPAFGPMRLVDLRPRHIVVWSDRELALGRGRTAVYRVGAASPALWARRYGPGSSPTTPAGTHSSPARRPASGSAGTPVKPPPSCATTTPTTRTRSPTCSRCCSAPACDAAKRSDCTGRMCT